MQPGNSQKEKHETIEGLERLGEELKHKEEAATGFVPALIAWRESTENVQQVWAAYRVDARRWRPVCIATTQGSTSSWRRRPWPRLL